MVRVQLRAVHEIGMKDKAERGRTLFGKDVHVYRLPRCIADDRTFAEVIDATSIADVATLGGHKKKAVNAEIHTELVRPLSRLRQVYDTNQRMLRFQSEVFKILLYSIYVYDMIVHNSLIILLQK